MPSQLPAVSGGTGALRPVRFKPGVTLRRVASGEARRLVSLAAHSAARAAIIPGRLARWYSITEQSTDNYFDAWGFVRGRWYRCPRDMSVPPERQYLSRHRWHEPGPEHRVWPPNASEQVVLGCVTNHTRPDVLAAFVEAQEIPALRIGKDAPAVTDESGPARASRLGIALNLAGQTRGLRVQKPDIDRHITARASRRTRTKPARFSMPAHQQWAADFIVDVLWLSYKRKSSRLHDVVAKHRDHMPSYAGHFAVALWIYRRVTAGRGCRGHLGAKSAAQVLLAPFLLADRIEADLRIPADMIRSDARCVTKKAHPNSRRS